MEGPGDWDLLTAHLAGDPAAFAGLVRRYERPVYRLALRYARDPDEAEELAQRTFLRVLDHATTLRPEQPFRAFLFKVAANLCKNHLRDRARLVLGVPLEAAAPEGESLEDKERRVRLRTALASLPLRQRQVVSLRIDADLPFAQVAEALAITENNAKVTFHHAMKRLKAHFAEEDS
ncbi:MAG: sigma-70 family RNA polymerase sigma factor [Deltaproteobacteria bacterium]|nr:sigma-70 family RNA polymerase sigma factor [Deltaproteobacteria bacterium]